MITIAISLKSRTGASPGWKRVAILYFVWLFLGQGLSFGEATDEGGRQVYWTLPLSNKPAKVFNRKVIGRYGVPFIEDKLAFSESGSGSIEIGGTAKRIFLLGMSKSTFIGCWADPINDSVRFFIGDNVGQIRLDYADGSAEIFPLVLSQTIWWGGAFYRSPEPFSSCAHFRNALAASLQLYPPAPVKDGNYVAVIAPKQIPLRSIKVFSSPAKNGTAVINGITIEPAGTNIIAGASRVRVNGKTPAKTFVERSGDSWWVRFTMPVGPRADSFLKK